MSEPEFVIVFNPSFEKGEPGSWSVWEAGDDPFPQPMFVADSRFECGEWIERNGGVLIEEDSD